MTRADAAELIQRALACGVMKWEGHSLVARADMGEGEDNKILMQIYAKSEKQAAQAIADNPPHLTAKIHLLRVAVHANSTEQQRKERYERIGEQLDSILPPYGTGKEEHHQQLNRRTTAAEHRVSLWREAALILADAAPKPEVQG